ncbi:hypothetical protein [Riemerella anatipestifer]|uniref:hypothetical protein n=1 Tax=Riemerella anatipestifer TaxID=34085 RepID=UPI000699861D|nr:hypothetical protein [Riemerella anatipestifer]
MIIAFLLNTDFSFVYFKIKFNFASQSSFMIKNNYQEDLSHIRSMMERSTRFISLSGFSGISAGLFAILGASYVYFLFKKSGVEYFNPYQNIELAPLIPHLIITAIVVLVLSIGFGIFFTVNKSRKKNLPIWTNTTKDLLYNLFLPLVIGGLFCIGLIYHSYFVLLAPATLIFYGLALINASKYTYSDIKFLGITECVIGVLSMLLLGWGLLFWSLGFGVAHIVYGIIMYKKYD